MHAHSHTCPHVCAPQERACAAYPEAGLKRLIVELPAWLATWAARWGRGSQPLHMVVLQLYAPGSSGDAEQQPVREFFVPILDGCRPC